MFFFQDCLEALVNHYLEETVLHKQGNQINPINRTEVNRGVCFKNWKIQIGHNTFSYFFFPIVYLYYTSGGNIPRGVGGNNLSRKYTPLEEDLHPSHYLKLSILSV